MIHENECLVYKICWNSLGASLLRDVPSGFFCRKVAKVINMTKSRPRAQGRDVQG